MGMGQSRRGNRFPTGPSQPGQQAGFGQMLGDKQDTLGRLGMVARFVLGQRRIIIEKRQSSCVLAMGDGLENGRWQTRRRRANPAASKASRGWVMKQLDKLSP